MLQRIIAISTGQVKIRGKEAALRYKFIMEAAPQLAAEDGVSGTPTFLLGQTGRALRVFQPPSLTGF